METTTTSPCPSTSELTTHHWQDVATAEPARDASDSTKATLLPYREIPSALSDDNSQELKSTRRISRATDTTATPLLSTEKTGAMLKGWSRSPEMVSTSTVMVICEGVFDFVLFACAAAFFAFAVSVAYFDQVPTAENPKRTKLLLNATEYGPSVFPILFALILGRTTHTVLRWRFERGERVGVLDTLATSTSLTSTVVAQFQLRATSTIGIVLMITWALSPLGGQASLRQMSIGVKNETFDIDFAHMIHHGYLDSLQTTEQESNWGIVNSMFISAMIGSVDPDLAQVDIWGNFKIPRIEYLEHRGSADEEGWLVTNSSEAESYTAMPTWPDPHKLWPDGIVNLTGPGAFVVFDNLTQLRRSVSDPHDLTPFRYQYISRGWNISNYRLDCNISTSYVEAEIVCQDTTSCAATRVRRSRLDHPPPNWTLLDLQWNTLREMFQRMLISTGGSEKWPIPLDRYLNEPATVLGGAQSVISFSEKKRYSVHMTHLLNSYFNIINGLFAISGGLKMSNRADARNGTFVPPLNPPDAKVKSERTMGFFAGERLWYKWGMPSLHGWSWSARGTETISTEVIAAQRPWVATLCAASLTLVLSSLLTPLIHYLLIEGPEILINVSSLATRDNAYVELPHGGTHLGAAARARALRDLELRFGDVRKRSDVGGVSGEYALGGCMNSAGTS
ncbi:hypothetical protein C7974DRAFT_469702 [Boeremia exigua]|uniref:uncharacterized protein n=1 Tax=Boeremia exigua TaxID=749465 RepID=UPI001E8EBA10|nr:uncharacterized protein C7974DRAFT_469702 [Boeremia exigua]KAH6639100.1 hypothetical protein C7974DRAFT_469702 [Boeremia exigua]